VTEAAATSGEDTVRADHVEINQGGANNIDAQSVSITQGGANQIRAGSLTVNQGGVAVARVGRLSLSNGAAFAVVADEATVEAGGNVLLLVARNTSGEVRPMIDVRSALAIGGAFAAASWLLRKLL